MTPVRAIKLERTVYFYLILATEGREAMTTVANWSTFIPEKSPNTSGYNPYKRPGSHDFIR